MQWSNEMPAQEGWYFERQMVNGAPYVNVKFISCDSRGRWWAGSVPGSRGCRVRAEEGTEYAGPIPMPEERT